MRAKFSLTACWLLAACGTTPHAPTSAAAPLTAAAVGQPAATSPATAPTAPAPESQAATESWARNHGFKPTMKAGGIWWCKSEPNIGTRIANAKPNCASIETLVEMQRISADSKEGIGERVMRCSGSGAGMQCIDTK